MLMWFKEASCRSLINIEQIVRIAPSGDSACMVHLADGQKIHVDHSIANIEKALAEVTRTNTLMPR